MRIEKVIDVIVSIGPVESTVQRETPQTLEVYMPTADAGADGMGSAKDGVTDTLRLFSNPDLPLLFVHDER